MGMYGIMRRATAADVARLRADPALVRLFLYDEPPAAARERSPGLLGFLLRFTPFKVERPAEPEPAPPAPPAWPSAVEEALDLDKAWHGVHFLFTGTAWEGEAPACFLLKGGEDVGDDDSVLPRLLRPEEVREFAAFVAALTPEELTRRYDPARMTALDIYPGVLWERDRGEELAWLLETVADLRAFLGEAAAAGDAVVVSVS